MVAAYVQWLVYLLERMLIHAPDYPNKSNVRAFLKDLITVIKEEDGSY